MAMNTRLASGTGVGLVVGALFGIIFDPMLGANGVAIVLGATFGIVAGAGVVAATGRRSKDVR